MSVRRRAAVAVAAAGVLLAGCTGGDGLPAAGSGSEQNGFISGDGTVVELAPADRGDPISFTGTTADGAEVDLADLRGRVVVLNTWYAGCAPCRKEAPDLQAVSQEYAEHDVLFLGVNTRDSAAVAQSFADRQGVTYESVLDADGTAQLALRRLGPQATPTTVVLDPEGRPAWTASGVVDRSTLSGMLDETLGLPAPGASATPPSTATGAPA